MKKKIIGIKLGSSTLVSGGKIKSGLIRHVCAQVATLIKAGYGVFIVTSGAIASDPNKNRSKNLRSAVGQPRIYKEYESALAEFGIETAQLLLVDKQLVNFGDSDTILTRDTLLEAFSLSIVPVINANDVANNEETKALIHCADNDKLFKLVCLLVKAFAGIIGFDQLGFLDHDKKVMHGIYVSEIESVLVHAKGGSALGHGSEGMRTKVLSLKELAIAKIQACLMPANEENFILRAIAQEENFGTRIFSTDF